MEMVMLRLFDSEQAGSLWLGRHGQPVLQLDRVPDTFP